LLLRGYSGLMNMKEDLLAGFLDEDTNKGKTPVKANPFNIPLTPQKSKEVLQKSIPPIAPKMQESFVNNPHHYTMDFQQRPAKPIQYITPPQLRQENPLKVPEDEDDMDALLKEIQGSGIDSLKEVINDINILIEARKMLNLELFRDLEAIKTDINNYILQLGTDTDVNKAEQLKLRQKQVDIEEIKIQEKLNCWRDIANLKEELRERIKEFREKESSLATIGKILE